MNQDDEDLPPKDNGTPDETAEMKKSFTRLVPSEAVRDFSSRTQVLKGSRVNSSLTLITTDSSPKDEELQTSQQPPSPTTNIHELQQKLLDLDSRNSALEEQMRDMRAVLQCEEK